MMQNKRWLIAFISISIASLFLGPEARANTISASSCSESDVSSALSKAASGDTVTIPAGTCTWTTSLSFTAPGSISIMGAGSQSTVGGGDQTIIIDNVSRSSSDVPTFAVISGSAQTVVRISGLTFEQNASSSQTFNGIVRIAGSSQNFRFDHNHFILFSGNPPNICMNIFNWVYGVIDHNLFDLNQKTVNNGVRISHGTMNGDSSGNGNGSWSAPTNFGSNAFIFLEDNVFNGGFGNDCNAGGRQVIRHNTLNDSNLQAHEMENDLRGCRAAELYANTFNGNYSGGDNIDSTFRV